MYKRQLYHADHGDGIRSISNQLILSEALSLLLAPRLDRKARLFQEKGISLMCDEFESMELAPVYRKNAPIPAPLPDAWRKEDRPARYADEIRTAFHKTEQGTTDFGVTLAAADKALGELSEIPAYFCMTRHLVESIARAAKLAPIHMERAQKLGLSSPESISRTYIQLQLIALEMALTLDGRAAQYQSRGIPIICQDVPPIP